MPHSMASQNPKSAHYGAVYTAVVLMYTTELSGLRRAVDVTDAECTCFNGNSSECHHVCGLLVMAEHILRPLASLSPQAPNSTKMMWNAPTTAKVISALQPLCDLPLHNNARLADDCTDRAPGRDITLAGQIGGRFSAGFTALPISPVDALELRNNPLVINARRALYDACAVGDVACAAALHWPAELDNENHTVIDIVSPSVLHARN